MPYVEGIPREQGALLPARIDDYVGGGSAVRVIDAFAWSLPIADLGFERAVAAVEGRPGYNPRMMLALWIYGYVNGSASSRKLEREAARNLEVIWLTQTLRPDFKTISDFRRDNKKALQRVFREFTKVCRKEGLISGELVGIDGSKFRAVNGSARNYSLKKLDRLQKRIDARIEEYLRQVEENDAREEREPQAAKITPEEMQEKIKRLREKRGQYSELIEELKRSGQSQISTTDPESRRMKTRQGTNVCYNAQTVVDSQHKLIVTQDVTNEPTDQKQLASMATKAKQELEVETLEVVADTGYSNATELQACEQAGITTYVPQPTWRRNDRNGRYSKEDFEYDAAQDRYICPAKQTLVLSFESRPKKGKTIRYYSTSACDSCALRSHCVTPSRKRRRIARRSDEDRISNAARRAASRPDLMRKRRELVEHPFGSIKRWINGGYFLLKGLEGVRAEFSMAALAYNIKRYCAIRQALNLPALA